MSSFAVIQLGGKQYKVAEGDRLQVEKLNHEAGKTFAAPEVLLVHSKTDTRIGTPYLEGVHVELKALHTKKAEKIRVFKMKAKKRFRRTYGHRQPYTEVEVVTIGTGKTASAGAPAKTAKPKSASTVSKKM